MVEKEKKTQEEKRLESKRKVREFINNLDKYCREEHYLEDKPTKK